MAPNDAHQHGDRPLRTKGAAKRARRKLTEDDVTVVEESLLKRAVAAAALGNAMEWFDFGIFAYLRKRKLHR